MGRPSAARHALRAAGAAGRHTRSARGPLAKGTPVTAQALEAFVAYRRALFELPQPNAAAGYAAAQCPPGDRAALGLRRGEPVPAPLRALAEAQCAAIESSPAARPSAEETLDVLWRHRLLLLQRRSGYRCNSDSLALAALASELLAGGGAAWPFDAAGGWDPAAPLSALDVGAGGGVMAVALALRFPAARVRAVELQEVAHARLGRNALLNGAGARVEAALRDAARDGLPPAWRRRSHVVVCNPPFRPFGDAGPLPRDAERAASVAEGEPGAIGHFAAAAEGGLADGGLAAFVFPAARSGELEGALRGAGLGRVAVVELAHGGASDPGLEAVSVVLAVAGRPGEGEGPSTVRLPRRALHEPGEEDRTRYAPWLERFMLSLPPA